MTTDAPLRRALWRVGHSTNARLRERMQNFVDQGYRGDDLLRRTAGIPLVRECRHEDQSGPYCGLCGGPSA